MFASLYWREVGWLWLIMLPLLVIALTPYWRLRIQSLKIEPKMRKWALQSSSKQPYFQTFLLTLVWGLLCIAIAGPRTALWSPTENANSHTMVLIDFSASMQAEDTQPSRRIAAIRALKQWLLTAPDSASIGIQLFAGYSHTLAIPTKDHEALNYLLGQVEQLQIAALGNNLQQAIVDATAELKRVDEQLSTSQILLLSDGDLGEVAQVAALQAARKTTLPLFVVAVGGDESVPMYDQQGSQLRINGRLILSRKQAAWLKRFSMDNRGRYLDLEVFQQQSVDKTLKLITEDLTVKQQDNSLWNEYFQIPLVLALVLLLFSFEYEKRILKSLLLLGLILPIYPNDSVMASEKTASLRQAQQWFTEKKYLNAQKMYARLEGYQARFGEAASCYRQRNFLCAIKNYSSAVSLTPHDDEKGKAIFNLANAYFYQAEFSQAAVLFVEARAYGADPEAATLGLQYAESALAAVRRYQHDVVESLRRAQWRAEAFSDNNIPAEMGEAVSFSEFGEGSEASSVEIKKLLQLAFDRQSINGDSLIAASRWIETSDLDSSSTEKLLTRLFELEKGIPSHPQTPRKLDGVRQW